SKPKSPKLKPCVYRGFFRCGECGCFITTETQKGHNYLRCTKRKNPCSQRYAREDVITSQIREEIKKVSFSVRTSALPTALCFWISKMPLKLRKNTMPRRFAPRQHLSISLNVKLGGEVGI
ncbi:MAG: zinc ribbon domain-containing protein, partial [bacterium]